MNKEEDKNDRTRDLFPSVTRALGDYLSDEEGNITRSKIVTLAGIAIVLGTLNGLNVQASHRSHSSHSSHSSGSYSGGHSSHASHSSHVSGTSSHSSHSSGSASLHSNSAPVQTTATEPTSTTTTTATTAATANGLTAQQAVDLAFQQYLAAGMDAQTAYARVQAILPQLTADPNSYGALVQSDLSALGIASTAAVGLTAAEAVDKAYALYIQAGLDSATAYGRVQAILAQLTASPNNYAAIVQADLTALGL